ncbi:hypothetical protein C1J03_13315 [Sulfitobacter sp. SK012]|uniref:hypothetical protein n=1 Tax=Sulfitobacter sp. SK012 TaxID=1389005 RepID=UPI000E0B71DC|nr:hypothetical protein [Sulfitobacter sp. SK012]AXI46915.1 hypothetical protein C1J03_13315 [Sulfitobacter sp. SK012]
MSALDAQLLAAHAAGDTAALVRLYGKAAEHADDMQAKAFFLTHAHVFALEMNHPDTGKLRQELIDAGREAPLDPARAPYR